MANDLGGGGGYKPKSKSNNIFSRVASAVKSTASQQAAQRRAQEQANMANRWISNYGGQWANQQAAQMMNMPLPAGGGYGGGGGGGRGYGGYRGGGGGYVDPYAALRKQLESSLNTQRDAARGALPKYLSEYNTAIAGIGKNNRAVTDKYSAEIQALMQQLIAQAQGAVDRLSGDLTAQGAGLAPLMAQADQALLGIRNTGTAQDVYNKRLAQMMAAAEADRLAAGASVNQAAQAQLDNAYMQALARIQGMR